MKQLTPILLFGTLVLVHPCWAAETTGENSADQPIDRVAAIVNEDIITESEVSEKIDEIKHQLELAHKDIPSQFDMRKKILDGMINQKLQLVMADRADIQVDQEELNDALENMAKRNNVTLDVMRQQIEAQGVSYAKFRKEIKKQIRLQKLQQAAVGSKVTVSDKEVNDVIKNMGTQGGTSSQYHIANILIALPEAPSTEQVQKAQKKADSIMNKLRHGVSFNKLANADSDDDLALQGGDLGWRSMAEIPDIFVEKIKTMKEGETAGPIRAPNGLHIIKLMGTRADNSQQPDKKQVRAMIYNRKMNEKVQEWIDETRTGAYVKIMT